MLEVQRCGAVSKQMFFQFGSSDIIVINIPCGKSMKLKHHTFTLENKSLLLTLLYDLLLEINL